MPIPLMTVIAQVMSPPRYKPTPAGMPVIHLNLRAADRREGPDGEWHDADEYEVHATAYKGLAENIRDSIRAGDYVICAGRIRTETWDGGSRVEDKLILSYCGPDLSHEPRRHEDVVRAETQARKRNTQ
jgi:single-stranded DNA-binding protein